jgi:serine protease Do
MVQFDNGLFLCHSASVMRLLPGPGRATTNRLFCALALGVLAVLACRQRSGVQDVARKVLPAVALVEILDEQGAYRGNGTGFFINRSGYLVTNAHVIAAGASAKVKMPDGGEYAVSRVVYEGDSIDLAVIAVDIPAERVRCLKLSGYQPKVGEAVVVVGSPLGLEQTVSEGIVSAVREVPGMGNVIQISAPISPGSSGSPVVTMNGRVIGVASAGMVTGQNLNFAVPVASLLRYAQDEPERRVRRERAASLPKTASADSLFAAAVKLYGDEDFEQALRLLQQVIRRTRNNGPAYDYIGLCQLELEQYKKAAGAFSRAARTNNSDTTAFFGLGLAYVRMRQYRRAADALRRCNELNPWLPISHYLLGLAYVGLRKTSEAQAQYETLKAMDSELAERLRQAIEDPRRLRELTQ